MGANQSKDARPAPKPTLEQPTHSNAMIGHLFAIANGYRDPSQNIDAWIKAQLEDIQSTAREVSTISLSKPQLQTITTYWQNLAKFYKSYIDVALFKYKELAHNADAAFHFAKFLKTFQLQRPLGFQQNPPLPSSVQQKVVICEIAIALFWADELIHNTLKVFTVTPHGNKSSLNASSCKQFICAALIGEVLQRIDQYIYLPSNMPKIAEIQKVIDHPSQKPLIEFWVEQIIGTFYSHLIKGMLSQNEVTASMGYAVLALYNHICDLSITNDKMDCRDSLIEQADDVPEIRLVLYWMVMFSLPRLLNKKSPQSAGKNIACYEIVSFRYNVKQMLDAFTTWYEKKSDVQISDLTLELLTILTSALKHDRFKIDSKTKCNLPKTLQLKTKHPDAWRILGGFLNANNSELENYPYHQTLDKLVQETLKRATSLQNTQKSQLLLETQTMSEEREELLKRYEELETLTETHFSRSIEACDEEQRTQDQIQTFKQHAQNIQKRHKEQERVLTDKKTDLEAQNQTLQQKMKETNSCIKGLKTTIKHAPVYQHQLFQSQQKLNIGSAKPEPSPTEQHKHNNGGLKNG